MSVLLASDLCMNPFVRNEEGLWAKIVHSLHLVLPASASARAEIPRTSGSEAAKGDLWREGRGSWCSLEMSVCLGQPQEMEEGKE